MRCKTLASFSCASLQLYRSSSGLRSRRDWSGLRYCNRAATVFLMTSGACVSAPMQIVVSAWSIPLVIKLQSSLRTRCWHPVLGALLVRTRTTVWTCLTYCRFPGFMSSSLIFATLDGVRICMCTQTCRRCQLSGMHVPCLKSALCMFFGEQLDDFFHGIAVLVACPLFDVSLVHVICPQTRRVQGITVSASCPLFKQFHFPFPSVHALSYRLFAGWRHPGRMALIDRRPPSFSWYTC